MQIAALAVAEGINSDFAELEAERLLSYLMECKLMGRFNKLLSFEWGWLRKNEIF